MTNNDTQGRRNVTAWVAIVVSFVTLLVVVFLEVPERVFTPEVRMVMSSEVLLVQAEKDGELRNSRVYLPLAFVNTGRSLRPEVIRDLTLYVTPEKDGEPVEGRRREFEVEWLGDFVTIPGGRSGPSLDIERVPTPLVVTRDAPQTFVFAFRPKEDRLTPVFSEKGDYSMKLVVRRDVQDKTLEGNFRVEGVDPARLKNSTRLKNEDGEYIEEYSEVDLRNRYVPYDCKGCSAVDGTP